MHKIAYMNEELRHLALAGGVVIGRLCLSNDASYRAAINMPQSPESDAEILLDSVYVSFQLSSRHYVMTYFVYEMRLNVQKYHRLGGVVLTCVTLTLYRLCCCLCTPTCD